jgi:hypothetical protein
MRSLVLRRAPPRGGVEAFTPGLWNASKTTCDKAAMPGAPGARPETLQRVFDDMSITVRKFGHMSGICLN